MGSPGAPSGARGAADVEGVLVNTVQLIGRIGSVFKEERFPRDGGEDFLKVRFLLKVRRPVKVEEGQIPKQEWVRVEVWGPTAASLMAWNRKGSRIGITGRMRGDLYQPEGASHPEVRMAVVAERIDFLSDPPKDESEEAHDEPEQQPVAGSNGRVAAAGERKR
jgi:single-stranded DNA-binding protein